MAEGSRRERLALGFLGGLFCAWALVFIHRSTVVSFDGRRYFVLFDDAMISMRYGWHLAHGQGLVWNPGERVEGYSNLLMTLLMAGLSRAMRGRYAVLGVQLLGLVFVLISGLLAAHISDEVSPEDAPSARRRTTSLMAFALTLGYYPLAYWSLMGMETGLLTVLLLGAVLSGLRMRPEGAPGFASAALLGLAFLTRPDSAVMALTVLGVMRVSAPPAQRFGWMLKSAGVFLVLPCAQLIFRRAYYGTWVPNTYVLKMTGVPVLERCINGGLFIAPFLLTAAPAMALAASGFMSARCPRDGSQRRGRWLLASVVLSAFACQVWVGGDGWRYWRMLAPVVPLLFVLALHGAAEIVWRFFARGASAAVLAAGVCCVVIMNHGFWPEWTLRAPAYTTEQLKTHVHMAVLLRAFTTSSARLGLIWAGLVPYYSNRRGVDFLGKCDPHVASVAPDRSGNMSFDGERVRAGPRMSTLPGHNKCDLEYSIGRLRPTYVEVFAWGREDVSKAYLRDYVRVVYRGFSLMLRRGAPEVRWDLVAPYVSPENLSAPLPSSDPNRTRPAGAP